MADLSDAVEALYADDAAAIVAAYKGGGSSVKVQDGKLGAAPVQSVAADAAPVHTRPRRRSRRDVPPWYYRARQPFLSSHQRRALPPPAKPLLRTERPLLQPTDGTATTTMSQRSPSMC